MKYILIGITIFLQANVVFSCQGKNYDTINKCNQFIIQLNNYLDKDSLSFEIKGSDSTSQGYNWYLDAVSFCLYSKDFSEEFKTRIKNGYTQEKTGIIFKNGSMISSFALWEIKSTEDAEKIYSLYRKYLSFCENKKVFITMFQRDNFVFFTIIINNENINQNNNLNKILTSFCKK